MRTVLFAAGEYYHIYNRGVEKKNIFYSPVDYERFILSMFALRGEKTIPRFYKLPSQNQTLQQKFLEINSLINDKTLVEIICFCLMPNHYHLLLKQTTDNGIPKYMHRLGTSFTKYSNKKRERSGYLFQGPFKAIHIDRNEYLMYLSRYIHLNSNELLNNRTPAAYSWSSYYDYISTNRWGNAINPSIILNQFPNPQFYRDYVEDRVARPIDLIYLLDK